MNLRKLLLPASLLLLAGCGDSPCDTLVGALASLESKSEDCISEVERAELEQEREALEESCEENLEKLSESQRESVEKRAEELRACIDDLEDCSASNQGEWEKALDECT